MKKTICNITLIVLSVALLFFPIVSPYFGYGSTMTLFISVVAENLFNIFTASYLFETILVCATIFATVTAILYLIKRTNATKILSTSAYSICELLWIIRIFAPYGTTGRLAIREELKNSSYPFLYYLYLIVLLTMIVLIAIQYISFHRRPSKAERLQAQIDELQKQVDELKKGD